MRIAFFTPLSPVQTAIADHSEGLLPHLAQGAEIDIYIDDGYEPEVAGILDGFNILRHSGFPNRADTYDLVVYAMGDNWDVHAYMHNHIQRYPGVVILHDTEFQHYFLGKTARVGDEAGYRELMTRFYGEPGRRAADLVLAGKEAQRVLFPLVEPIIDWALGVIVHNPFAEREVLSRRPRATVRQINSHFYLPPGTREVVDKRELRAGLGLKDQFIVATYGLFIPDKRINVCLEAFRRLRSERPDMHYLLVGDHSPYYDLPGMIQELGLEEHVTMTGWMEPAAFVEHMHLADVAIHLRYPHIGGTPYSPIRLLGLGRPTVISDIEPLAYFPEGACAKLKPDADEEDLLVAIVRYLANHDDLRRQMGENGRRFVLENHSVEHIARRYLAFFREIASNSESVPSARHPWQDEAIREIAGILAEWGLTENDDELLHPIAESIADLGW